MLTGTAEPDTEAAGHLKLFTLHHPTRAAPISNQVVAVPGVHPVKLPRAKTQTAKLYHLSWSQIRTEALIEQANRSVSDPDQAWILAEFIRYLEHQRSGAIDFDDMGPS
ncbi:MAG: hypothetical protein ACRDRJ_53205, partial [Streptosporangiaceae bacterium]